MKRRSLFAALSLSILALSLASCSDATDSAGRASPSSTEGSTTAAPTTTTPATTDDPDAGPRADLEVELPDRSSTHRRTEPKIPEITLISAGEEPRRELRLDLSPGATTALTMSATQEQRLEILGQGSHHVAVTYAIDLDATVLSMADDVIEYEMTYGDVRIVDAGTLSPTEVRQTEALLEPLVGLSFFGTIDNRGTTLILHVPRDIPGLTPQLEQMMNEFEVPSLPLPIEAVGVGARWSIESELTLFADQSMPMVTEYELVELHDDHMVVNLHSAATLEPSTMRQGGVTAEFQEGDVVSTGTMTWWFNSMQPLGETKVNGSIRFTESAGNQSVQGEMFTKGHMVVKPRP